MKKPVITKIDGKNLDARFFTSLGRDEGISEIIADGITKDKGWATKAYDQMVSDVKAADALGVKDDKAEVERVEAQKKLDERAAKEKQSATPAAPAAEVKTI